MNYKHVLNSFVLLVVTSLVVVACSDKDDFFRPKPKSYFRIAFPEKRYEKTSLDLPFEFEKPVYSVVQKRKNPNQLNLIYPLHKATVHFTYFSLEDKKIQPFLEDAYNYAYKHNSKASAIDAKTFAFQNEKVYGLAYDLKGNVASPIQFYATDSVAHFLRGALYFEHSPNSDSISPVLEYIKSDIEHFYTTLKWGY